MGNVYTINADFPDSSQEITSGRVFSRFSIAMACCCRVFGILCAISESGNPVTPCRGRPSRFLSSLTKQSGSGCLFVALDLDNVSNLHSIVFAYQHHPYLYLFVSCL